jgi:hypothetical protein
VIISGLLPRRDELNKKNHLYQQWNRKVLRKQTKYSFIHHENISTEKDFYDNKHLNERGVKFFTKNIKFAYFNTKPKKMTYIRKNLTLTPPTKETFRNIHTQPHSI